MLESVAKELKLDVKREHDLAGVAQYYLNHKGKKRTALAELVKKSFPDREIPEAHRILARLPIRNIWTTNFDTLFERAWRENNKRLDVKTSYKQHAVPDAEADGILYKMHGCVSNPAEVVMTTDDFELYLKNYPGFQNPRNFRFDCVFVPIPGGGVMAEQLNLAILAKSVCLVAVESCQRQTIVFWIWVLWFCLKMLKAYRWRMLVLSQARRLIARVALARLSLAMLAKPT